MNLTFTTVNNVDLLSRKDEQGSDGAAIRKELSRRKQLAYGLVLMWQSTSNKQKK